MTAPEQIARWLIEARAAVAFTGAGVSTESGIPDFRSPGGVWSKSQPVYFDEFLASAAARREYWRQKAISHADFVRAAPNAAHRALARWESAGLLRGVITQNIDGLHQLAGSSRVLELHGTAREVACLECEARYDAGEMLARFARSQAQPGNEGEPPPCESCGGITKHATVSFGQQLPPRVLEESIRWANEADLFLTLGSSLVVEPAASLPRIARESGARLVIINREATPLDFLAEVVIHAPLGATVAEIERAISVIPDPTKPTTTDH